MPSFPLGPPWGPLRRAWRDATGGQRTRIHRSRANEARVGWQVKAVGWDNTIGNSTPTIRNVRAGGLSHCVSSWDEANDKSGSTLT